MPVVDRHFSAATEKRRTGRRAQGTEHRAQGTEHRAQSTGHRAQGAGQKNGERRAASGTSPIIYRL